MERKLKLHVPPTEIGQVRPRAEAGKDGDAANADRAAAPDAPPPPAAPQAVKAEPVRLRRRMTLEDAFRRMGLNCLRQIEANVDGVLARDVESLHQMRVGLRRLRALLDMFGELAPAPEGIATGLDWLAGELGATRDWDVLADSTLDRIVGIDTAALRDSARSRAAVSHRTLAHSLQEPRFGELLAQVAAWLRGREWRAAAADGSAGSPLYQPALAGAQPLLRKAGRRLRKRIAALDPADAPARHRVRIAAKKARYGAEFFRDLLPKKAVKRYLGELSALQDRLGALNDIAVAQRLLPALQHGHGELAREAAYAHGYVLAAGAADARTLGKALKRVARLRMPR